MPAQLRQQPTLRNRRPQSAAQPSLRSLAPWSILGPGATWVDLLFPTGSLDWIVSGVPPFRIFQTAELPTAFEWDGGQLRLFYDTIPDGTFDMLFPVQCSTFRPPWGGWVDSSQHTFTVPEVMGYALNRPDPNTIVTMFAPVDAPIGVNTDSAGTPLASMWQTVPGAFQPVTAMVLGNWVSLSFSDDIAAETHLVYVGAQKGVFSWDGRNPTTEPQALP